MSLLAAGDVENGPAEGASYWAALLSDFAGHLREDQDDLNKGLRKRSRTEKAAALAGIMFTRMWLVGFHALPVLADLFWIQLTLLLHS